MVADKRRAAQWSEQHDNMIVVNDEETTDDEHLLDLQLCADNNEESKDPHTQESSSPTAVSESTTSLEKGTQQEDAVTVLMHEEKLPTSTFSLMFLAEPFSRAHIYAWTIFSVQLGIVLAAIVDNFDATQPTNPAHFPPGSPTSVTVAQAIMIPLAVAAQNDFVTGVVRLNDRKTVQVAKRINSRNSGGGPIKFRERVRQAAWLHPGTTYSKWVLSSLAQLFIGFGILVVSFVFMMQSETVFQVLVNFVALSMISNISSIAYLMAANGFLGFRVWQNTQQVTQHVVQRQYKSDAFKQACYALAVLAMYSGYFCVIYRQQTGFYQCRSVLVQFEDEFDPHLPYLTGRYEITTNRTHNRFVFADDASPHSSFSMAFCEEKEAWTISESHHEDPCQLLTASQTSSAYDVSLTGGTSWRAISQRFGSLVDTTSFLLQCTDCDETFCQPHRGTCVDNRCVCKDGRYGLHCEFQAPCEEIVLNAERGPFPAFTSIVTQDNVVPANEYRLLKGDNDTLVLAYDRPVYVSRGFEFAILFTGRRWALINPRIAILQGQVTSITEMSEEELRRLLVAYLRNRHLYKTLTSPSVQQFAVSEAVEFGSPLDIGVPIGLNWLGVRSIRTSTTLTSVIDRLVTYDVSFVCLYCDPEGDECANLSRCDPDTRTCVCHNDTVLGFPTHTGPRCEKSLTCMDVQQQSDSNTLATGCFGEEFTCMTNGECSCVEEFPDAGRFCQFLPCYSEAVQSIGGCQNNSTCSTSSGQCICDSDFFQGRFCEEEVPACFDEEALMLYPPTGCFGEGSSSCNNATGFCNCPPGRAGRYCERALARCDDAVMMEIYPPYGCATTNSTCNTETGQCDCPNPTNGVGGTSMIFQGVSCEITHLACDHPDVQTIFPNCTGHGVCNTTNGFCDCESASFDGRYCQLDVGAVVFNETENDR